MYSFLKKIQLKYIAIIACIFLLVGCFLYFVLSDMRSIDDDDLNSIRGVVYETEDQSLLLKYVLFTDDTCYYLSSQNDLGDVNGNGMIIKYDTIDENVYPHIINVIHSELSETVDPKEDRIQLLYDEFYGKFGIKLCGLPSSLSQLLSFSGRAYVLKDSASEHSVVFVCDGQHLVKLQQNGNIIVNHGDIVVVNVSEYDYNLYIESTIQNCSTITISSMASVDSTEESSLDQDVLTSLLSQGFSIDDYDYVADYHQTAEYLYQYPITPAEDPDEHIDREFETLVFKHKWNVLDSDYAINSIREQKLRDYGQSFTINGNKATIDGMYYNTFNYDDEHLYAYVVFNNITLPIADDCLFTVEHIFGVDHVEQDYIENATLDYFKSLDIDDPKTSVFTFVTKNQKIVELYCMYFENRDEYMTNIE